MASTRPGSHQSRAQRSWYPAVWLMLYLGTALLFYGRDLHWQTDIVGPSPAYPDPFSFIWLLAWWPWAFAHGSNPLVTRLAWYPDGYPLTWATSVPTASALALPVTLLANAVAAYNFLTVTAPALSSWSAYWLSRRITRDEPASAFAGALFGFSSYEAGQLQGHLNLDLIFLVPVIVLLCHQRLVEELSRGRFVVLLAVTFVLQFGLSAEMTVSIVVLGFSALVVFLLIAPRSWSWVLLRLAGEIAAGGVLALTVLVPWLVAMWRGADQMTGFINPPSMYSTDMLNLVIPTHLIWLGHDTFSVASRFTGSLGEQGGYLGFPLVIILAACWRDHWRSWPVRALLLSALLMIVASLGPALWVGGVNSGIVLPWRMVVSLPVLRGVLPCRFMAYASLCIGVAVAFWIAASMTKSQRRTRIVAAACSIAFLLPNPLATPWAKAPIVSFFDPDHIVATLGRDRNVLVLPFDTNGAGMLWQWQARMRFTQTGGALSFIPRRFQTLLILTLQTGRIYPSFQHDLASLCDANRVSFILIGPGTDPGLISGVERLNWPEWRDGRVLVIRNPSMSGGRS